MAAQEVDVEALQARRRPPRRCGRRSRSRGRRPLRIASGAALEADQLAAVLVEHPQQRRIAQRRRRVEPLIEPREIVAHCGERSSVVIDARRARYGARRVAESVQLPGPASSSSATRSRSSPSPTLRLDRGLDEQPVELGLSRACRAGSRAASRGVPECRQRPGSESSVPSSRARPSSTSHSARATAAGACGASARGGVPRRGAARLDLRHGERCRRNAAVGPMP